MSDLQEAIRDCLRFLADTDLNGARISELPKALIDADLLVVASWDGLVEIGECKKELSSSRDIVKSCVLRICFRRRPAALH